MTPFLWLVVTGYAVFMLTLGGVSIWTWLPERGGRKAPVAARLTGAGADSRARAA